MKDKKNQHDIKFDKLGNEKHLYPNLILLSDSIYDTTWGRNLILTLQ